MLLGGKSILLSATLILSMAEITNAGGLCSDVFTSRLSFGASAVDSSVHFAYLPFTEKRGHSELFAVRDGKATSLLRGKQINNTWKDKEKIQRISGDIFGLSVQVFGTGPMSYLQIYKYNGLKNEMMFYGDIPVREDAVFGIAQREVFPLDNNTFIVSDHFANFVSPYKEYLDTNPDIHFTVVEVTESGLTRKNGVFSDREKVKEGQRQGVLMSGMSAHEIVLFDKSKVRIFRYKEQKFKEEEVLSLNLSDSSNLKLENFKFKKISDSSFQITSSNGEVVVFQRFNGLFQQN